MSIRTASPEPMSNVLVDSGEDASACGRERAWGSQARPVTCPMARLLEEARLPTSSNRRRGAELRI